MQLFREYSQKYKVYLYTFKLTLEYRGKKVEVSKFEFPSTVKPNKDNLEIMSAIYIGGERENTFAITSHALDDEKANITFNFKTISEGRIGRLIIKEGFQKLEETYLYKSGIMERKLGKEEPDWLEEDITWTGEKDWMVECWGDEGVQEQYAF
ncbi:hypothetical protein U8V72_27450 [Priestia filamentosa]|uniref:hypothetical protein n=1 Tax=Priestia filamentosa TaxID=1402861 RepID=UPI00397B53D5